ncbi:hypothetical protein E2562_011508 [Oryza meyeriana var. granulata]|uniref:KIB1-4 beta-propeller domain-containing protein n=1 Tax=Oryza meyeriana var. granulata TaxID=110450 RepID=A0A6G1D2G2_9ORYZ|nr:hypothetical protein E2562_011508 [Oryza meyeriana var. granulata]
MSIGNEMAQRPCKRARTTSPCSPLASWRDLPLDIAGEVLRRLPSYADRICFGATCRPWRSSARQHRTPPPLSPCLCFTDGSFRGFFPEETRPFRLPAAAGWHGSCGEWLVYERHDGAYVLVDPFSKAAAMAPLPCLSRLHVLHESIVAVDERDLGWCRPTWLPRESTSEPQAVVSLLKLVVSPAGLVAAVVGEGRHGKFALCRPGAAAWSISGSDGWRRIKDMAFYQGKLYAVDLNEVLLAVTLTDNDGEPPAVSRIDRVIDGHPPGASALLRVTLLYLVESGGELLLVRREVLRSPPATTRLWLNLSELEDRFTVFKADFRTSRWTQVRTIGDESGDRALFVGRWCSRAVRVTRNRWANQVFFLEDGTGDEWHTREQRCSLRGSSFGWVEKDELLPLITTADGHDLEATWLFPRETEL